MPVACMSCGERPFESLCGQSFLYHFICRHVIRIIVVDEFVLQHRPVCEQSRCDDHRDADREVAPLVVIGFHSIGVDFDELVGDINFIYAHGVVRDRRGLRDRVVVTVGSCGRCWRCLKLAPV